MITAITLFLAVGCSGSSAYDDTDFEVGRKPELFNAGYLWGADDSQNIVMIDRAGHTLQHFGLEPFEHKNTIDLPLDYVEQGVLSSVNAGYFVTIADEEYAIVKPNGDAERNPVELFGEIETAAFDPENHVLVLSDSTRSLALLVLTNDGTVQGTWKAGSLFTDEKYIVSGTMITEGRLVLALEGGTIALVDVAKSVADQAWSYTSFDLADTELISWMAAIPDDPDVVMMTDESNLYMVDVERQTVVATQATDDSIVGKFRDYEPHVITRPSSEIITVYYWKDGALVSQSMRGADSYAISQSYLDSETEMMTVVYDQYSSYDDDFYNDRDYYTQSEVYRFRLSDNLAMDKTSVDDEVSLVVTPSFLVLLHESILGKATRSTYGKSPERITLEAYNFKSIQDQYKD